MGSFHRLQNGVISLPLWSATETSFVPGRFVRISEPFNPDSVSQMVKRCIEKAEIGRSGSCHLFRHSCATHILENGADIRFIQQLLGHAKLDTTQVYTEVSIKQLQEVHARTHPVRVKKIGSEGTAV